MRAIALSLGQELPPPPPSTSTTSKDVAMEEGGKAKEREDKVAEDVLAPLDVSLLDGLADDLLEGTLSHVSQVRGTVHRACGLICALVKRNGPTWKRAVLTRIKDQVKKNCKWTK